MDQKPTIHETIRQAEFATNVELIDVPLESEPITLLRTKEMPEFAFVMWVSLGSGTMSQMRFRMPSNEFGICYPVVCACCPSETYDLEMPDNEDERNRWQKALAAKFKDALVSTCRANGISTIFMRRANAWREHYGDAEGLAVVEAMNHLDAYLDLYGRKIVRDSLRFINYRSSQGLEAGRDG